MTDEPMSVDSAILILAQSPKWAVSPLHHNKEIQQVPLITPGLLVELSSAELQAIHVLREAGQIAEVFISKTNPFPSFAPKADTGLLEAMHKTRRTANALGVHEDNIVVYRK